MSTRDPYGHERHPLLGRAVEDIATGRTGVLRAVMATNVPTRTGSHRKATLAYLAPADGGLEWTTAPCNIKEVHR